MDSESSRGRDGVAAWRLRFDEAKVNPLNVGDPCVAVAIAHGEFRRRIILDSLRETLKVTA
jgi:hypothetical protein